MKRLTPTSRGTKSISTVAVAVIVVVIIVIAAVAGFYLLQGAQSSTTTTSSTTSGTTTSSASLTTESSTTPANYSSVHVNVGILPTADAIPFLISLQNGYFAQQGLAVNVTYMAGGAVIAPAVAQGSIQIGESSIVGLMASNEQGFNFKFFAPMSVTSYPNGTAPTSYVPGVSTHILAVQASSNIHTWKDLVGKTVAVNTLGAITQVALDQALEDNGVDPSTVHIVAVAPPNWLSTLEQGRVDAIDFFEPFSTELVAANQTGATTGAFRIIGDTMHLGTINQADFFSTSTWINSNPTIVRAFINALNKGIAMANANTSLARQVLVSQLKMNSTVAQNVNLYHYPTSPMPESWMQIQIQLGLKWGLLKNANDNASSLVDPNYLQLTSSGTSANPQSASLLLDFTVTGYHGLFYYGLSQGIYAKNGIQLSILAGSGSAHTIAAVATGKADFGFADTGTLAVTESTSNVTGVKIVATVFQNLEYAVIYNTARIHSLSDLNGKTIGDFQGSGTGKIFPVFCAINGINYSSINFVYTTPATFNQLVALGQADAVISTFNQVANIESIAAQNNITLGVFGFSSYGMNTYGSSLITSQNMIDNHPDLVASMVKATMESILGAAKNPSLAAAAVVQASPSLNLTKAQNDFQLMVTNTMPQVNASAYALNPLTFGWINATKLQNTLNTVYQGYGISNGVSVSDLYTNEFTAVPTS